MNIHEAAQVTDLDSRGRAGSEIRGQFQFDLGVPKIQPWPTGAGGGVGPAGRGRYLRRGIGGGPASDAEAAVL